MTLSIPKWNNSLSPYIIHISVIVSKNNTSTKIRKISLGKCNWHKPEIVNL